MNCRFHNRTNLLRTTIGHSPFPPPCFFFLRFLKFETLFLLLVLVVVEERGDGHTHSSAY
jgi:hypothetical protein